MYSFTEFINKEIVNKYNEKGVVESLNNDNVVIKYSNETKTYKTQICFANGFLTFVDDQLNQQMKEIIEGNVKKKEEDKQALIKNQEDVIHKYKKITEQYRQLCQKDAALKSLFGKDFDYPPLVEFKKKYKNMVLEVSFFDKWNIQLAYWHLYD